MTASEITINRVRKTHLVLGALQMLVCCLWGLLGDIMIDRKVFAGAHHQFSHNGEVELVLALAVPWLALSDFWFNVFNVTLAIGTWSNPIAYAIIAITGEKNAFFGQGVNGTWGKLSEAILVFVCAPTIVCAFTLAVIGAMGHVLPKTVKKQ